MPKKDYYKILGIDKAEFLAIDSKTRDEVVTALSDLFDVEGDDLDAKEKNFFLTILGKSEEEFAAISPKEKLFELLEKWRNKTIDNAYKKKARKKHTDKGGDNSEFQNLKEAKEVLSNMARRGEYNRGEGEFAEEAAKEDGETAQPFDAKVYDPRIRAEKTLIHEVDLLSEALFKKAKKAGEGREEFFARTRAENGLVNFRIGDSQYRFNRQWLGGKSSADAAETGIQFQQAFGQPLLFQPYFRQIKELVQKINAAAESDVVCLEPRAEMKAQNLMTQKKDALVALKSGLQDAAFAKWVTVNTEQTRADFDEKCEREGKVSFVNSQAAGGRIEIDGKEFRVYEANDLISYSCSIDEIWSEEDLTNFTTRSNQLMGSFLKVPAPAAAIDPDVQRAKELTPKIEQFKKDYYYNNDYRARFEAESAIAKIKESASPDLAQIQQKEEEIAVINQRIKEKTEALKAIYYTALGIDPADKDKDEISGEINQYLRKIPLKLDPDKGHGEDGVAALVAIQNAGNAIRADFEIADAIVNFDALVYDQVKAKKGADYSKEDFNREFSKDGVVAFKLGDVSFSYNLAKGVAEVAFERDVRGTKELMISRLDVQENLLVMLGGNKIVRGLSDNRDVTFLEDISTIQTRFEVAFVDRELEAVFRNVPTPPPAQNSPANNPPPNNPQVFVPRIKVTNFLPKPAAVSSETASEFNRKFEQGVSYYEVLGFGADAIYYQDEELRAKYLVTAASELIAKYEELSAGNIIKTAENLKAIENLKVIKVVLSTPNLKEEYDKALEGQIREKMILQEQKDLVAKQESELKRKFPVTGWVRKRFGFEVYRDLENQQQQAATKEQQYEQKAQSNARNVEQLLKEAEERAAQEELKKKKQQDNKAEIVTKFEKLFDDSFCARIRVKDSLFHTKIHSDKKDERNARFESLVANAAIEEADKICDEAFKKFVRENCPTGFDNFLIEKDLTKEDFVQTFYDVMSRHLIAEAAKNLAAENATHDNHTKLKSFERELLQIFQTQENNPNLTIEDLLRSKLDRNGKIKFKARSVVKREYEIIYDGKELLAKNPVSKIFEPVKDIENVVNILSSVIAKDAGSTFQFTDPVNKADGNYIDERVRNLRLAREAFERKGYENWKKIPENSAKSIEEFRDACVINDGIFLQGKDDSSYYANFDLSGCEISDERGRILHRINLFNVNYRSIDLIDQIPTENILVRQKAQEREAEPRDNGIDPLLKVARNVETEQGLNTRIQNADSSIKKKAVFFEALNEVIPNDDSLYSSNNPTNALVSFLANNSGNFEGDLFVLNNDNEIAVSFNRSEKEAGFGNHNVQLLVRKNDGAILVRYKNKDGNWQNLEEQDLGKQEKAVQAIAKSLKERVSQTVMGNVKKFAAAADEFLTKRPVIAVQASPRNEEEEKKEEEEKSDINNPLEMLRKPQLMGLLKGANKANDAADLITKLKDRFKITPQLETSTDNSKSLVSHLLNRASEKPADCEMLSENDSIGLKIPFNNDYFIRLIFKVGEVQIFEGDSPDVVNLAEVGKKDAILQEMAKPQRIVTPPPLSRTNSSVGVSGGSSNDIPPIRRVVNSNFMFPKGSRNIAPVPFSIKPAFLELDQLDQNSKKGINGSQSLPDIEVEGGIQVSKYEIVQNSSNKSQVVTICPVFSDDRNKPKGFHKSQFEFATSNPEVLSMLENGKTKELDNLFKSVIFEAAEKAGIDKIDAAKIILIAIKNKGFGSPDKAKDLLRKDGLEKCLKDLYGEDHGLSKKAINFAGAFQDLMKDRYEIFTTNKNKTHPEDYGMRLKKVTPDKARDIFIEGMLEEGQDLQGAKEEFERIYSKLGMNNPSQSVEKISLTNFKTNKSHERNGSSFKERVSSGRNEDQSEVFH